MTAEKPHSRRPVRLPGPRTVGIVLWAVCLLSPCGTPDARAEGRPNVVLIMTDDQGYGDLACHGNQQINTPHLDRLHAQSVRLTDYHVDPTCSPTRSALMTGRYSSRTGVWHTIMGRSIIHPDETTIAEVFSQAGYATGCFGKWHLGDNAPCRPQDQGFQSTLVHGGGGVGQTPDYFDNDYFDDTYWRDGVPQQQSGYCTDVFFDAAIDFIAEYQDEPFLCYLPTNAAHGPFLVADEYSQPYKDMGIQSPRAEFYGMITNIDDNVGRLRERLNELGLAENTILIFTTDNGTAAGHRSGGFNAGMRAAKGSPYEGGHRVPFFVHWPAGGIVGGRDLDRLAAHIDVLPTLAELCDVDLPDGVDVDGQSLVRPLSGEADLPERTLFVHSQRIEYPEKWRQCSVMTEQWRLVNGKELFAIANDPGQKQDVAQDHPDVVEQLRAEYERWYEHVGERFEDFVSLDLGGSPEPVRLTCHDWHTENGNVPWHQGHVRKNQPSNGFWTVNIKRAGTYAVTVRVRPEYLDEPLNAARFRVSIADQEVEAASPAVDAPSATAELRLPAGPTRLQTWLLDCTDGKQRGAYFVDVTLLKADESSSRP